MSQGDYHKARVLLNEIYQSIQGRDFGEAFTYVVRILAELEWGTGKYSQADQWLTELQRITVTMDFRTSADLGWAKVALSRGDWYLAAEHTITAAKKPDKITNYFQ